MFTNFYIKNILRLVGRNPDGGFCLLFSFLGYSSGERKPDRSPEDPESETKTGLLHCHFRIRFKYVGLRVRVKEMGIGMNQ